MGEEGSLSSTDSAIHTQTKTEVDIPALKPLRWKHSQRKVHDPWKIYCGATFCYDVLEVSNRATPDEIRKSYRKLSREWHPDKHPEKKVADVKFKLIARAYEVVGKGKLERESYDYLMDHPEVREEHHFSRRHCGRHANLPLTFPMLNHRSIARNMENTSSKLFHRKQVFPWYCCWYCSCCRAFTSQFSGTSSKSITTWPSSYV